MITVNRRERVPWEPGLTVAELKRRLRYTHPHIIVSINGEVVPEEEYERREIPDGAEVRFIHLMAGG